MDVLIKKCDTNGIQFLFFLCCVVDILEVYILCLGQVRIFDVSGDIDLV